MAAPLNLVAPARLTGQESVDRRRLERFTEQVAAALNAVIAAGILIQTGNSEWTINPDALPPSGVTPGTYTVLTATINSQGLVTAASSGGATEIVNALGFTPAESPLTTKGDLWTYSTADARLPVGLPGQVLMANPATATGLEWSDSVAGEGCCCEILVEDGSSAPPIMLTNEAEDDFLYSDCGP